VTRGVLADYVHHRHVCPARIVQVRQAVSETRAEMQKSTRRFFSHACVAIRRSRNYSLKEANNTVNFRHVIECGHEMNLGSAGIRETRINTSGCQGANQTFRTIHLLRRNFLPPRTEI
jgi:hypothetical protein